MQAGPYPGGASGRNSPTTNLMYQLRNLQNFWETNTLISQLKNVPHPTVTTCCLCETTDFQTSRTVHARRSVQCYTARYVIKVFILWSCQRHFLPLCIRNIGLYTQYMYHRALHSHINICMYVCMYVYTLALEAAATIVFMVGLRSWMQSVIL
jgi:hypothetical protein